MQIVKGNIITLSDNKKYLVLSKIDYSNEKYLYLSNLEDPANIKVCREESENESLQLVVVTDKKLIKKLFTYFFKDMKTMIK